MSGALSEKRLLSDDLFIPALGAAACCRLLAGSGAPHAADEQVRKIKRRKVYLERQSPVRALARLAKQLSLSGNAR